jgi:glycosyltransferase involved in cell wall biosynthesis
MSKKKKVLMCAESHSINSGFGKYTKEIMSRLHDNKNYEVAEFASYLDVQHPKDVPWKVYPNAVKEGSKDFEIYKSNPLNQFGQWRFDKVVLHFKPDIVFDIRDYWMFSYQEMSPLLDYFHWVVAPTIDSIPQKTEWLTTFENADKVLTHTDWAMGYLKSLNRPINLGRSVSDSVDTNIFKPIGWTKALHKAQHALPTDSIIIGSVMRNQKRKLIAELFNSLRELIDKTQNKKIYLYLHTSYPEQSGWNIPELLQEYGVYNNVLFTYYNPTHKSYHASLYKGAKAPSLEGDNTYCIFPNVIHGVTDNQLANIYNLFDIYVQYAICEGLGIPQLEAASCGIPIFAVNYSGMSEIINKIQGTPIDYILQKELETGSDRAAPFNSDLVNKIIDWINLDAKTKRTLSIQTRESLVKHYGWNKTVDNIIAVFDDIEPKNIWDRPLKTCTTHNVADDLSNRDFVNFIIDKIICEPRLKRTYFIQNLIRSMDEGFSLGANNIVANNNSAVKQNAVKTLEVYLNNKIYCEKIRSGEINISSEDYLNY